LRELTNAASGDPPSPGRVAEGEELGFGEDEFTPCVLGAVM
jgi:hypothetical protein